MSQPYRLIEPKQWNATSLKRIITEMAKKRILVIGDVGVDRYTLGTVERISPEAPVPIVWVQEEKLKLGLAANVADNVRTLGGLPLLVGVVGRDRTAEDFLGLLKETDIDPRYIVQDSSRRTVLKERVVSERQQLLRIDYESLEQVPPAIHAQIIKQIESLIPTVDCVVLEDYAKGLLNQEFARTVFELARKNGKSCILDPHSRTPSLVYRGATAITPNLKEAEALTSLKIRGPQDLQKVGHQLLEDLQCPFVVITLGKDGIAVFKKGEGPYTWIPTCAREVYDVSGAGDTVIAVLALALSTAASIEESSILANIAAGVEVGKRGTATVSPQEVIQLVESQGQPSH